MFRSEPEVLVVGAGPVGLFAALQLARRGHRVRVIDKEWRPAAHSYALALHGESLSLLEEVGLLGPVLAASHRIRKVGFYDGTESFAEIDLNRQRRDFAFVAVLRQDLLEKLLVDALSERGVRVWWNHEMTQYEATAAGLEITVDKLSREGTGYAIEHGEWVVSRSRTVRPHFVIGADGHRSRIRTLLGASFPEVGPTRSFAVFEFRTETDLGDEMKVMLADDTVNLVWPLADGYSRWSFEVKEEEAPTYSRIKDRSEVQLGGVGYPILEESALRAFLSRRAPWFKGDVDDIRWRLMVRFERRLSSAVGEGPLWLAGDALHMTGPVGVQSMNVGLREARDLADALSDILDGHAGTEALDAYRSGREAEWDFLLGIHRNLRPTRGADPRVAKLVAEIPSMLPASGADLEAMLSDLGLRIGG